MQRLTILEIIAPVTGEAKPEVDMRDGGGHNINYVVCLTGEKIELGDFPLYLECLVPELLGVKELLLVQDVPGGHGHG